MRSEFVKITAPEKMYGEKNLLQGRLELIHAITRFKEYERLRKEEFALKIALKSKIEEAKDKIKVLDNLMPKIKFKEHEGKKGEKEIKGMSYKQKMNIEQEIADIKRKLENLKNNY